MLRHRARKGVTGRGGKRTAKRLHEKEKEATMCDVGWGERYLSSDQKIELRAEGGGSRLDQALRERGKGLKR